MERFLGNIKILVTLTFNWWWNYGIYFIFSYTLYTHIIYNVYIIYHLHIFILYTYLYICVIRFRIFLNDETLLSMESPVLVGLHVNQKFQNACEFSMTLPAPDGLSELSQS